MKDGLKSVVFNGGTWISNDSVLTTTAEIAKVPGFEGGKQFYKYKLDGNMMELTMYDETYPNGDKPAWYGKVKTKFVLSKIQ